MNPLPQKAEPAPVQLRLGRDAWRDLRTAGATELEYYEILLWEIAHDGPVEPSCLRARPKAPIFRNSATTPAFAWVIEATPWIIAGLGLRQDRADAIRPPKAPGVPDDILETAVPWMPRHPEGCLASGLRSMVERRDRLLQADEETIRELKAALRTSQDEASAAHQRIAALEDALRAADRAHELARLDHEQRQMKAEKTIHQLETRKQSLEANLEAWQRRSFTQRLHALWAGSKSP